MPALQFFKYGGTVPSAALHACVVVVVVRRGLADEIEATTSSGQPHNNKNKKQKNRRKGSSALCDLLLLLTPRGERSLNLSLRGALPEEAPPISSLGSGDVHGQTQLRAAAPIQAAEQQARFSMFACTSVANKSQRVG